MGFLDRVKKVAEGEDVIVKVLPSDQNVVMIFGRP